MYRIIFILHRVSLDTILRIVGEGEGEGANIFGVESRSPEKFLILNYYIFGNFGDFCGGLFLIFPKFGFLGPGLGPELGFFPTPGEGGKHLRG